MIFEIFAVGPLAVNCFLLGCKQTKEAVLVDPGGDFEKIVSAVTKHGLSIKYIINTHGHFDHVGANSKAVERFKAPLMIHQGDAAMLERVAEVSRMYGFENENSPPADKLLVDGMEIVFGNHIIKVIHTPGHTQGGCCLYLENRKKIITGDTLFADSIGRTDLPGGSHEQLLESISSRLFTLPEDVSAYPGHGQETTIGHEKRHNPYF